MINNASLAELQLRLSHRHSDGSWEQMKEVRSHHDAAEHDIERQLKSGRIFRCATCDEYITIDGDEGGSPQRR